MSMCILALRCTHIYKQSRCQTKYLTKAFVMSGLLVFGFCVECDNRELFVAYATEEPLIRSIEVLLLRQCSDEFIEVHGEVLYVVLFKKASLVARRLLWQNRPMLVG